MTPREVGLPPLENKPLSWDIVEKSTPIVLKARYGKISYLIAGLRYKVNRKFCSIWIALEAVVKPNLDHEVIEEFVSSAWSLFG
jgi:hypothetical protein